MMLENPLFWLMLLGHLLGDFYFQSETMVQKKRNKFGWLVLHCLLYTLAMAAAVSPVLSWDPELLYQTIAIPAIPALSHAFFDFIKEARGRKDCDDPPRRERKLYLIDQALHLLVILAVAIAHEVYFGGVTLNPWGELLAKGFGYIGLPGDLNKFQTLRLACALLVIGRPANISIRTLTATKKEDPKPPKPAPKKKPQQAATVVPVKKTTLLAGRPLDVLIQIMDPATAQEEGAAAQAPAMAASEEEEAPEPVPEEPSPETLQRMGHWIGVLERLLVLVLMFIGQYAAIGLVFTAKSLIRIDRIARDRSFGEYYLIGTLSSILFAMGAVLITQPFL